MSHLTQIEAPKSSNFDAHHPPSKELIADCVHCGFCLPACPTYVLWGDEMDSPRGRIYMMKKTLEGQAPLDQTFRLHMDNCLGCMGCMTACPSGVQYGKLIEETRAQIERNVPRTTADSLFRKLLFATFPYTTRLRLIAIPTLIYQRSGPAKPSFANVAFCAYFPRACPQWNRCSRASPTIPFEAYRSAPLRPPRHASASACSPAACNKSSSSTSTKPPPACLRLKVSKSSFRSRKAVAEPSWSTPASKSRRSTSPAT